MHILYWMSNFWPAVGGTEVYATRFLRAMRARGYEFVVIAGQSSSELSAETWYDGVPVYRFPFWKCHDDIEQLMEIRQKVADIRRAFRPDLIHRNAVGVGDFFLLTTANAHPAPLLVSLRGSWLPQADSLVAHTLGTAQWVTGCSRAILDRGLHLVPDIAPRSSVIYTAVDQPAIPPDPLLLRPPRLLCLGRLAAVKGFDLALQALALVADRFHDVRLVIAGRGPERERLLRLAADLRLDGRVEFIGWVAPNAVPALLNTVTMVLIPSRFDAFPLVGLEAALMARPVIAARVGGLPELVVDQETGLLVEPEDAASLAEAISFLLVRPTLTSEMGCRARRRVLVNFRWADHIQAYDALYRKLMM